MAEARRGPLGFANVARKYDRLDVALEQNVASTDERLIDTAADLCVYTGKYLTWIADQSPDFFSELPATPPASSCADAGGLVALTEVLQALASREAPGESTAQRRSTMRGRG